MIKHYHPHFRGDDLQICEDEQLIPRHELQACGDSKLILGQDPLMRADGS